MPRDAVSRTANVERNGGHKWVNGLCYSIAGLLDTNTQNNFRILTAYDPSPQRLITQQDVIYSCFIVLLPILE